MARSKMTPQEKAVRDQIEAWLWTQVRALVDATKEGEPAVVGVQADLKRKFPNRFDKDVKWRTYRQFVGRVICKIMRKNRYVKDHRGEVKPSDPFSNGMIYRKDDTGPK